MKALLPLLFALCAAAAARQAEPVQPLPPAPPVDAARVELGRRLYNDRRLSADNTVACASCHDLARGGADGQARSLGTRGRRTDSNAPSIFNSALNFRQSWSGRAATIEEQIDHVVDGRTELGTSWDEILRKLARDEALAAAFRAAYPLGLTRDSVRNALASYSRSLWTPDAPFDRWLRGDESALTPQEKAGYARFKLNGCAACHQGANVGGNMFQKFGVMGDYFGTRALPPRPADMGRYQATGLEQDRHVFKVPSLRNVALTAPYFHDGSAATLEEAVEVMFRYQLGRTPSPGDLDLIVRFLKTLSGTAPRGGPP